MDAKRVTTWIRIVASTLLLAGVPGGASAAKQKLPAKVQKLVKQLLRPTPADLLKAYGGKLPAKNPFNDDTDASEVDAKEYLPKMIAQFEKAYPGATYAALGRDAVRMADMFAAYYETIGQPNRVARINLSTGSFTDTKGDEVKPSAIAKFITTHTPLRFKDPAKIPGFVIFDATSYSESSQSPLVMDAIYEGFTKRGFSTQNLPAKVNIVSIDESNALTKSRAEKRMSTYFAQEKSWQLKRPGSSPHQPLDLIGTSHGEEWHDSWDSLTWKGSRYVTVPTAKGDVETHKQILSEFYETLKLVQNPAFRHLIEAESKALGIKAPHLQKASAKVTAEQKAWKLKTKALLTNIDKTLRTVVGTLRRGVAAISGDKKVLSANAGLQANADDQIAFPSTARKDANHITTPFFTAVAAAFDAGHIGVDDFRQLVWRALSSSEGTDQLNAAMVKLGKQRPSFRREMDKAEKYFEKQDGYYSDAMDRYRGIVSDMSNDE
jgi:hypothetical protein